MAEYVAFFEDSCVSNIKMLVLTALNETMPGCESSTKEDRFVKIDSFIQVFCIPEMLWIYSSEDMKFQVIPNIRREY